MKQRPEAGEESPGAKFSILPRGRCRVARITVYRLGCNAVSPLMSQAGRNGGGMANKDNMETSVQKMPNEFWLKFVNYVLCDYIYYATHNVNYIFRDMNYYF